MEDYVQMYKDAKDAQKRAKLSLNKVTANLNNAAVEYSVKLQDLYKSEDAVDNIEKVIERLLGREAADKLREIKASPMI